MPQIVDQPAPAGDAAWLDPYSESSVVPTPRAMNGAGTIARANAAPGVTAMEIASLLELAPGRLRLCVGPGEPELLRPIGGQISKPLATTGAFIDALRHLFSGRALTGDYPGFSFENFTLREVNTPPIDIAAIRPRMLGLPAQHADGAALSLGASRHYIKQKVSYLEDSRRRGLH